MALKNLIVMRHAKSSWKFDDLSDHERPLNGRGRKAAKKIGQVLSARGLFPQTIWSSDSMRTRETVARLLGDDQNNDVQFDEGFYHAGANKVLYLCQQWGEPNTNSLMLVGHNPGWEELVYYLSGLPKRMPTGACAIFNRIDSDESWLSSEAWKLHELLLPRDFED